MRKRLLRHKQILSPYLDKVGFKLPHFVSATLATRCIDSFTGSRKISSARKIQLLWIVNAWIFVVNWSCQSRNMSLDHQLTSRTAYKTEILRPTFPLKPNFCPHRTKPFPNLSCFKCFLTGQVWFMPALICRM